MVKVRIDLLRDDGLLPAAPAEPAPVRAADEVEAPEALKKRGDAAFRRGEAAAAARLWTRAAAAGRGDRRLAVACLANTARAQVDLGRAADALCAAAEALSLDPDHARARYFRARALLALGRRAEADEEIACLVAREPDNPRVLELKAEAARVPEAPPAEVDVSRGDGDAARAKAAAPVARAGAPPAPPNAPTDPAARARSAARPAFATTWTAMAAREAASAREAGGREAYAPPASRFNVDAPKAPPPAARADPAAAEVARLRAARRPEASTNGAPRSVHAILAEKRKARRAARAAPAPASATPATAWTAMAAAEAAEVANAITRRPTGAPPKRDRKDRGPSGVEPMNAGPHVAEAWTSLETDESAKQKVAARRNDAGAAEGDATARRKARQVLQEARARKKSGVVRAPVADSTLAELEDEHRERLEEYRRRKEALAATRAALFTKKGGSKV